MALPCETYKDSDQNVYASVPDCCYWETPCGGCPWLLSGRPGLTTQCLTRQFGPTSTVSSASCPACSAGYSTSITSSICCWTSDAFDATNYCATVSPCLCTASQTHAVSNPMLPPSTNVSLSPLQCVSSCKDLFAGGPYYQLAGDTCVDTIAFAETCPIALTNTLGKKGTQRTLIKDGVCDVSLDLVSVNGSTQLAADINNANNGLEVELNQEYKTASVLVWVGLGLLVLGLWGNRAYTPSKVKTMAELLS